MKKFGILVVILLACNAVYAQKLGLQAGYSLTHNIVSIKPSKVGISGKPVSGFTVGPIFSWDFYKGVGADIAIMANMRGANLDVQEAADKTTRRFYQTFYYLDIPLHVYYKGVVKDVELSVFAGPSFNIGIDGSNYAYELTKLQKPLFSSKIDNVKLFGKDNAYQRFEIGIDLGVLVEYKNVQFKASYMRGLNNISHNKATPYGLESIGAGIKQVYKQGVFSFTVGYVFNLKRSHDRTFSK